MNVCTEGQGFAQNANPLYNGIGLKGHPGADFGCSWGTPITSRYTGNAYKVFTFADTPNRDGFTEVDIIVDDGLECFEWQVGHLDPTISPGPVEKGDIIGTEANHGPVYSGNILVTIAMQKAGDQRGHHRHYQMRPVRKIAIPSGNMLLGMDGGPYKDPAGWYYQVWNFENGYRGCCDPTLPVFNRLLHPLNTGYDVYVLQRILCKYGLMNTATGFFGSATYSALQSYQRARGISPVGFAGPQTQAALNKELQPLPDLSGC